MKRNKKEKQAQQRAAYARQEMSEQEMRQFSGGVGVSGPKAARPRREKRIDMKAP